MVCDACSPSAEEVLQARGLYLLRRRDYDRFLQAFQSLHLSNARDKSKEEVPPKLFRGWDDESPTQLGKTGFTAPRHLDDVGNDDKWAHLTRSKNHDACMLSTDESRLKIRRRCQDRLDQGRPYGKVAVIATHRIGTPIRRVLTEVLGCAELEHRPGAGKVLQRIGTEWWIYANIPPQIIMEILTYEEFLEATTPTQELQEAELLQRTKKKNTSSCQMQIRISLPNNPEVKYVYYTIKIQGLSQGERGTAATGGSQSSRSTNKGVQQTKVSPKCDLGTGGNSGRKNRGGPAYERRQQVRQQKHVDYNLAASRATRPTRGQQSAPTTFTTQEAAEHVGEHFSFCRFNYCPNHNGPECFNQYREYPTSWEGDSMQSLSLRFPSPTILETIVVRPQETATGLSEMDSLPPNQWRNASEESRDAPSTRRHKRSKKGTPSGLRRIQKREHLQRGTEGASLSEGTSGGRQDKGTEKSVSYWPSYDKQDEEFNQLLLECPKGQQEARRGMDKEGVPGLQMHTVRRKRERHQVTRLAKAVLPTTLRMGIEEGYPWSMVIRGTGNWVKASGGILYLVLFLMFYMTEMSKVSTNFIAHGLFDIFENKAPEFFALYLAVAHRADLTISGRTIMILFGTMLSLPRAQATPFQLLDSTMAPPGWAAAGAAVVAAQTAVTMWRRWKYSNPTPAVITPSYSTNMSNQADNLQSQLETLITQQNTSNQELNEGLIRYNALVATHNTMAQENEGDKRELNQRRRELAEAMEKLKEYEKQTTKQMKEIERVRKDLNETQAKIEQLTEAAKEGGENSQRIAKLQEELEQAKKGSTD
ncbi:hypothetical protein BDD12DRAFT_872160 [Trichophaea hybrida]|nr:hypothetical protein BDD12DRAFT_872160 [Trichophaea hybrida]